MPTRDASKDQVVVVVINNDNNAAEIEFDVAYGSERGDVLARSARRDQDATSSMTARYASVYRNVQRQSLVRTGNQ